MKIVLIGDSSVGKSALVYRFVHNRALTDSKATVGIAFVKQNIMDPETNEEYTLQIWDTAGQEKFQSVTTHHYRAADGALLVYDVSSQTSFRNLDKWLSELRENTDPTVVVAVVGTKVDLEAERVVSSQAGQAYARQNGLLYMETSSLWDKHRGHSSAERSGVEGVLLKLMRAVVLKQRELGTNPSRLDVSNYYEASKGVRLETVDEDSATRGGSSCRC